MMRKRKVTIGRIPREWFSNKYKELAWHKRLLLKRTMNKRLVTVYSEVENAKNQVVEFNKRLAEIAMDLSAGRPVKVSLQEEKQTRNKFSEERKRLGKEIEEFQNFVSPYFWGFDASGLIAKPNSTPLEIRVHEIGSSINAIKTYLGQISKSLDLIELKLREKR